MRRYQLWDDRARLALTSCWLLAASLLSTIAVCSEPDTEVTLECLTILYTAPDSNSLKIILRHKNICLQGLAGAPVLVCGLLGQLAVSLGSLAALQLLRPGLGSLRALAAASLASTSALVLVLATQQPHAATIGRY